MSRGRWSKLALVGLVLAACGEQAAEQTTDEHGPPVPPAPALLQEVADSGPAVLERYDTSAAPAGQR